MFPQEDELLNLMIDEVDSPKENEFCKLFLKCITL